MKRTKQIIALGLAVLLGSAPLSLVDFPSFATEQAIPDRVLFSSSFEATDKAPASSKSDNGYYNNVESTTIVPELDGEFTDRVVSSSISGDKAQSSTLRIPMSAQ